MCFAYLHTVVYKINSNVYDICFSVDFSLYCVKLILREMKDKSMHECNKVVTPKFEMYYDQQ